MVDWTNLSALSYVVGYLYEVTVTLMVVLYALVEMPIEALSWLAFFNLLLANEGNTQGSKGIYSIAKHLQIP